MSILSKLWKFFCLIFSSAATTTTTTTRTSPLANKKALCMGINDYPGTNNDLRGCVNDANGWESMLSSKGFSVITLLNADATKSNVISNIKNLLENAVAGDELFITYSGHGSNVTDINGDEDDGRDETWYLYDGNLIDDEIRDSLSRLPNSVKLTIVSDSCHSGSVTRAMLSALSSETHYCQARYMPPKDDLVAISVSGLPIKKSIAYPEEGMNHILITGCKSTEYSYDASFNGMSMGAMSHFALLVLRDNPDITYRDFYAKLSKQLPSGQYPQSPQLEGKEELKNQKIF